MPIKKAKKGIYMPKISLLCQDFSYECLQGDLEKNVEALVYDSRKVTANSVFFCMVGAKWDGHDFCKEVVEKGATALVVSKKVEDIPENVTVILVEDTRKALAHASSAWFNYPSKELTMVGITGTKGKTTVTCLIKSILEQAGHKVGLIGTIETVIGDTHIPMANTTPEPYILQMYLRQMVDNGCDVAVMEVSSQGLMQARVDGIHFEIAAFTNIEKDHISPTEHKDFDDYFYWKKQLFYRADVGIFNVDDKKIGALQLSEFPMKAKTFGIKENADYKAVQIEKDFTDGKMGMRFVVPALSEESVRINTPGTFSVHNALLAMAVCDALKVPFNDMKTALNKALVKGRMEPVFLDGKFSIFIDYAHNAMALESLLKTVKEYSKGRVICIFGCGGNRSRDRRFEMGEVSGKLADLTVITTDNPRFEDPKDIMKDIETGILKTEGKYVIVEDRKEAVRYAITNARENDMIILAGKGHEDYQEICGVKYHMDERELIEGVWKEINS